METNFLQNWPSSLQTQLNLSKSHEHLFSLLGPDKSFIAIFEIFSRSPLPKGTKPVMSRVPPQGSAKIDELLEGNFGDSSKLAGFSFVVVMKTIHALPVNQRNAPNIRRMIEECMNEALKFDLLIHDITTAARTLARLNLSRESSIAKSSSKGSTNEIELKGDFNFESLSDRPQDWKSSHWWTGE